jgi:hypothetical protein
MDGYTYVVHLIGSDRLSEHKGYVHVSGGALTFSKDPHGGSPYVGYAHSEWVWFEKKEG